MRDSAELMDEIVADAMIDRQMQAWRPSRDDFAALEALAAGTGRSLPELLNEALRDLLSRSGKAPRSPETVQWAIRQAKVDDGLLRGGAGPRKPLLNFFHDPRSARRPKDRQA